ncbi:MAG TPA: hypothetical protein VJB98_03950 [Candidatus Paceibacterota bacterium]
MDESVAIEVACPFCKSKHKYAPGEILISGEYKDRESRGDEFHDLTKIAKWRYILCRGALRHVIVI